MLPPWYSFFSRRFHVHVSPLTPALSPPGRGSVSPLPEGEGLGVRVSDPVTL
jgi:hypothetical protein